VDTGAETEMAAAVVDTEAETGMAADKTVAVLEAVLRKCNLKIRFSCKVCPRT